MSMSISTRGIAAPAVLALVVLLPSLSAQEKEPLFKGFLDVRDFGAKGDGKALDTDSIQAAVDACAKAGGGTVCLHSGTFLSGTIRLKSNVTLFLDSGAVLLGSRDLEDYPVHVPAFRSYTDQYTDKSLIYAEGAERIALLGRGTIDGQGASFKGPYKVRPYLIRFIECRNVRIRDITLRNSPMWVEHYLACEDVAIQGITVRSKVNANNDGINIDSCANVRISNCDIDSGDDAIVLKSTSSRPTRNVTITNCVLSTFCNALKLGTESNGGFRNITISNCAIHDTRLAGIALELVDGGVFDRVNVSDIVMHDVGCAVFIRLGNRARPFKEGMEKPGMGSMRNIFISNIQADRVGGTGCSITGLPDHPVEDVTLYNVRISFKGGGTLEHVKRKIPEKEDAYPEFSMFGTLPAYGFFTRHVKGIRFLHVDLDFEKTDDRPALIFEDVEDLEIFDFRGRSTPSAPALIRLNEVQGAFLHGCRPVESEATFLELMGGGTKDITLQNNDFTGVERVLKRDGDVSEWAVKLKD